MTPEEQKLWDADYAFYLSLGGYDDSARVYADEMHKRRRNWGLRATPLWMVPKSGAIRLDDETLQASKTKPGDFVQVVEDEEPKDAAERLIESSVPKYRNSEWCATPGCNKKRVFVRMDFVCPDHG